MKWPWQLQMISFVTARNGSAQGHTASPCARGGGSLLKHPASCGVCPSVSYPEGQSSVHTSSFPPSFILPPPPRHTNAKSPRRREKETDSRDSSHVTRDFVVAHLFIDLQGAHCWVEGVKNPGPVPVQLTPTALLQDSFWPV